MVKAVSQDSSAGDRMLSFLRMRFIGEASLGGRKEQ